MYHRKVSERILSVLVKIRKEQFPKFEQETKVFYNHGFSKAVGGDLMKKSKIVIIVIVCALVLLVAIGIFIFSKSAVRISEKSDIEKLFDMDLSGISVDKVVVDRPEGLSFSRVFVVMDYDDDFANSHSGVKSLEEYYDEMINDGAITEAEALEDINAERKKAAILSDYFNGLISIEECGNAVCEKNDDETEKVIAKTKDIIREYSTNPGKIDACELYGPCSTVSERDKAVIRDYYRFIAFPDIGKMIYICDFYGFVYSLGF